MVAPHFFHPPSAQLQEGLQWATTITGGDAGQQTSHLPWRLRAALLRPQGVMGPGEGLDGSRYKAWCSEETVEKPRKKYVFLLITINFLEKFIKCRLCSHHHLLSKVSFLQHFCTWLHHRMRFFITAVQGTSGSVTAGRLDPVHGRASSAPIGQWWLIG